MGGMTSVRRAKKHANLTFEVIGPYCRKGRLPSTVRSPCPYGVDAGRDHATGAKGSVVVCGVGGLRWTSYSGSRNSLNQGTGKPGPTTKDKNGALVRVSGE